MIQQPSTCRLAKGVHLPPMKPFRMMWMISWVLAAANCSLVTVPVKTVGKVAETTVKTTGGVVEAPFKAAGGGYKKEGQRTD
jgi:hypothetical protein